MLANLDDYGLWLAAVVAGLTAVGWIVRKGYRASRDAIARAAELARKIDALDTLAQRELTHSGPDGWASTKDYARTAAGHALAIESLERTDRDHASRLQSLEDWRRDHVPWSEDVAAQVRRLLDALEDESQ